jgi:hypothetical protein
MAKFHITLDKFRKLLKCALPGADVVETFHTAILGHQEAVADF